MTDYRRDLAANEPSVTCKRCGGCGSVLTPDCYWDCTIEDCGVTCPDCLGRGRISDEEEP